MNVASVVTLLFRQIHLHNDRKGNILLYHDTIPHRTLPELTITNNNSACNDFNTSLSA